MAVSLPPELLGAAESLSAFVADALRTQLARDRGLAELARVLGGPPPPGALAAVRRDLGLTRGHPRRAGDRGPGPRLLGPHGVAAQRSVYVTP